MLENHGDDLTQREVSQLSRRFDCFPSLSTISVTDQSRYREEDRENLKFLSPENNPNRAPAALRRELIFIQRDLLIFRIYVSQPVY